MQWALIDFNGIVQNLIAYHGDTYTPPLGLSLQQVNDWVQIGDMANESQPEPAPAPSPIPTPDPTPTPSPEPLPEPSPS